MLAVIGRNRTVRIARGRIVGHEATAGDRVEIDADVLPGLINAHDHLGTNHYGAIKHRERYEHASDWADDVQRHPLPLRRVPEGEAVLFGALKNLVAGVTTVAHHDPRPRAPLPIRLAAIRWTHSPYAGDLRSYRRGRPWVVHLAEGIDDRAASELDALHEAGGLHDNTVIVHGLRAEPERVPNLVWCPTSNRFLFGETVDPTCFWRVALGSDSRLTGCRDLLDEVAVAAVEVGQDAATNMVTTTAAAMLQLQAGTLDIGAAADIVVMDGWGRRDRVRLVLVGGEPSYGDVDLMRAAGVDGVALTVDGRPRLLSVRIPGWMRVAL